MVRISISQAVFDALAAMLSLGSVGYESEVNERGERLIWLEAAGEECPSSDDLRQFVGFREGGSGSSVVEVMRRVVGAASDDLRLSGV